MGILSGLAGIFGGGEEKKAAKRNNALLSGLKTEGTGIIDQSSGQATGYLNDAGQVYSGLANQAQGNLGYYKDALGLNGAEGNAATMERFQAGPGYQFALDQGLSALERRAGAQGRLQGGETALDTLGYAQGLANQEYNNWLGNLQGYDQQQNQNYLAGLGGKAGTLGDLANLAVGTGDRRLNLASEVVNGKMGANNQYASGANQQAGGFGSLLGGIGGFLGGFL